MFAYYEPKQYREAESKRSQFLTAIVNLYGLFKDCGPFLGELLKTGDSILVTPKWKAIQNDYNMPVSYTHLTRIAGSARAAENLRF